MLENLNKKETIETIDRILSTIKTNSNLEVVNNMIMLESEEKQIDINIINNTVELEIIEDEYN